VKATLYTDGGSRGNPGPSAYAYVLEDEDGKRLASRGETIGSATNNEAEYRGLISGLQAALDMNVTELEVRADSLLMVQQMRGEFKVKKEELRVLSLEAARLARQFDKVEYRHIPREKNKLADRLVNDALDGKSGAPLMTVREAIEAGDITALGELLAADVVFRSPAVYKPYQGRDVVIALLGMVSQVFENFRYRAEWNDGDTTILFFEANVGDRELQGVDILEHNDAGLVERFTVMIRPLSGLQAVAAAVQARLG
jgi:ribonuclease HI